MPSKILIFCGKGGVGKTTISLAVALKHAAAGKRVLVVTSHPLSELAISVSLEGLSTEYPVAAKNLFLVHLGARDLLSEVVERSFPVSAAADQTVRSAIFRNLVEVAPGLKEFYFLARLQQLADREAQSEGRPAQPRMPQYELLIWDAPASGHFLTTLRSAHKFERHASGPLATAWADVARFFSRNSNVTVVPVTTLEEMALAETIDMAEVLGRDYNWKGASVLLNMVSPVMTADRAGLQDLGGTDDPALKFVFDRGRIERERAELLQTALGIPGVAIPRLIHDGSDLAMLGQLAGFLDLPASA